MVKRLGIGCRNYQNDKTDRRSSKTFANLELNSREKEYFTTHVPSALRTRPSMSKVRRLKLAFNAGIGDGGSPVASPGNPKVCGRTARASRPVVFFPSRSVYKTVRLYVSDSVLRPSAKVKFAVP